MNFKTLIAFCSMIVAIFSPTLYAAGPVMHAYLGEKWIQLHERYNNQQEGTFIRGTLFPDIQYLGVISRDETHFKNLTLYSLEKEKNPFDKGVKLHSLVDEEREKMVVRWGIYNKLKNVPGQAYISTFLKMLEDEILYTRSNWNNVKGYLSHLDEEEKQTKVDPKDIIKWHNMTLKMFIAPPSKVLDTIGKRDKYFLNVPPKVVRRWSKLLPVLAQDAEMRTYVDNLMQHFDIVFKGK